MAAPVAVTRAQVLAHRVAAAQGLDRSSADPAVLDLGVQDTPPGSAGVALAAVRRGGCGYPGRPRRTDRGGDDGRTEVRR
ncbi:hypothetical protein C6N75_17400 [Streptomyces solincola]|uniref:Uncharacterized protein n=1 Tax=Streptomyces solincola TaxID=2100817 RepID=A0A2S9PU74_9ACTN|nr:hypothetical protein [Streptomyces solincola]PRH77972.1 hypothetical protein C6N75_17400 [Streptomyces solincola]